MLCEKCSDILKGSKRLARVLKPGYDLDPFINGGHYDTIEQFQAAANGGCHFCSIIMGSLRDIPRTSTNPLKWTVYNLGFPDDGALTLKLHLMPRGGPAENPQVNFRLHPVKQEDLLSSLHIGEASPSTGSQSSWKQAVSWIEGCMANHKTCGKAQKDGLFKPTRLLKVDDKDPEYIRVCEKEEIPDGTIYTTLSHCWGLAVIGKLLTTNIDSLKKGIPLKSLVQTFQDAIEVTRRFKVSYIWIDCLCIIQDSRDDWKKESMAMESVYGNSYCNIAATASADGRGGLFRERDPKMVEPCMFSMNVSGKGKQTQYQLSDFPIWWDRFENSALNVRAWVLQERLLAPRVLHFDRDQLAWECNELTACERNPTGMGTLLSEESSMRRFRLDRSAELADGAGLDIWRPIVNFYSASRITQNTDRLVAIYGVAMKVQKVLDCEYHSGLWARDIEGQLAWKVVDPTHSSRPNEHVAPSWAWASVVGEVDLIPGWGDLDRENVQEEYLCEVLDIGSTADLETNSAIISHEMLTMRCFLLPVTIIPVEQSKWDGVLPGRVDDEGNKLDSRDEKEDADVDDDGGVSEEDEEEDEDGDEDYGEQQEGDDGEDMEEQQTPWVALYRTRDGSQNLELGVWREVDTESEWDWKTPRRRWLMPTSSAAEGMCGIILERRKADGGRFRRCGAFRYRSEDEQRLFWSCCHDFRGAGLEKRRFDGVVKPVLKLEAPLLRYEIRDKVMQYVISII